MININVKQGDIVDEHVDAIVNAANNNLSGGSGVDGAIHYAAGWDKLDEACEKIGYCNTGEAVITPAFDIRHVKWIIHTVGPFCSAHSRYIEEPNEEEERLLYNCYYNSLKLADEYGCKTISFPCIAIGIYGYPVEHAPAAVKKAIEDFKNINRNIKEINIVCFEDEAYEVFSKKIKEEV